jgi:hypothetical protein
VAEGGGLLNRYRVVKPYRGFESLRLRQLYAKPAAKVDFGRECPFEGGSKRYYRLMELAFERYYRW